MIVISTDLHWIMALLPGLQPHILLQILLHTVMHLIKDTHSRWAMDRDGISVQEISMIMQSEQKIRILLQLSFAQDTVRAISVPVIISVRSADEFCRKQI